MKIYKLKMNISNTLPEIDEKLGTQYAYDPRRFSEWNEHNRTPFFMFFTDGKPVTAAHLSYSEVDGVGGAADRFYEKFGEENSHIFCYDPLLKWGR